MRRISHLDPITVSEKLDNKNSLNKVGGKDYLIELATSTPSAANLEAYAEIIRQRSITRQLMKTNSEISELIQVIPKDKMEVASIRSSRKYDICFE